VSKAPKQQLIHWMLSLNKSDFARQIPVPS